MSGTLHDAPTGRLDDRAVDVAIVGLGRMGAGLARRITRAGHRCAVFDLDPSRIDELASEGMDGVTTLGDIAAQLRRPRAVWVMVPAAATGPTITAVAEHLDPGDIVVDGGNSFYGDDIARASELAAVGIHHVDVGTSGGVWGLDRGYCLMVGGEEQPVRRLEPLFDALAPGTGTAQRTPGRVGTPSSAERGWLHCGPHGAGHYVKMVHNGIEYGLMAAVAEGLNILATANCGAAARAGDAETAPLRRPDLHQYDFDIPQVAELWRRGSVISSWLMDLTAAALVHDADLDGYVGRVSDSGEGRWTIQTAIDQGVPSPVLASAVYQRFTSQGNDMFAAKVLSAMRAAFGGHQEQNE